MTNPTLAHRLLTSRHDTMAEESSLARLTLRKTGSIYHVTVYDKQYGKVLRQSFKTQRGALISYDNLKVFYL